MTNLRDTEDGINEAGWEKAMQEFYCERCKRTITEVFTYWTGPSWDGPSEPEHLCGTCYDRRAGIYPPSAD